MSVERTGHRNRNFWAAVRRRVGAERQPTDRFRALSSHYLFEPCFARPGEGHDKGGVEARGKGLRLEHLTPIPQGQTLEVISHRPAGGPCCMDHPEGCLIIVFFNTGDNLDAT